MTKWETDDKTRKGKRQTPHVNAKSSQKIRQDVASRRTHSVGGNVVTEVGMLKLGGKRKERDFLRNLQEIRRDKMVWE